MNRNSHSIFLTWFFLAATALMLSACASTPSDTASPEPQEPATAEVEPWDGHGLDIPLDGSSMDAWSYSLARVQAHTTENEYKTLTNAIEYLLLYDLGAQGDMERLIQRLDGLTAYEIVGRVAWRQPAPGKGPAEKGAADAKIIDS